MNNARIEMRLLGTKEDMQAWIWLLKKLQEKEIISINDLSGFYKNRGLTKEGRLYVKASCFAEIPREELPTI